MELRRLLASDDPEVFLPDLADSLNNLGVHLGQAGCQEEGWQATSEALSIFRALSTDTEGFHQGFAKCLINWGERARPAAAALLP